MEIYEDEHAACGVVMDLDSPWINLPILSQPPNQTSLLFFL